MNYEVINSNSSGNCIILEEKIMLDCGVAFSRIKSKLKNVKIIFISHVHKDHLFPPTVKRIAYEKPTIKFLCGNKVVLEKLLECGVMAKNIIIIKNNKWYDLGMFRCMVQEMQHDTPNNCIHLKFRNKKILYIVDTANVDNVKAKDYDLYLIEGNYDEDLLEEHKKEYDEQNKYDYLYRVEQTHLSTKQAFDFLVENMGANSEYQFIHQSTKNTRNEV